LISRRRSVRWLLGRRAMGIDVRICRGIGGVRGHARTCTGSSPLTDARDTAVVIADA
jgi:hypothetical protein